MRSLLVTGVHTDLVVAREGVHEAEAVATMRLIRGRDKLSFGQTLLMSVKSMKSRHLSFVFFYENNVSQPFKVLHFFDCLCLEKLTDLFINRLPSFWSKTPSLFLDRLKGEIDVQLVGNHCRVDPAHVFLFLGEYLHVLLQKTDKRAFDAFR